MLLGFRVTVLFGHAEIHHVDHIGSLGVGTSNEEIVGFDVTVDQVLFMDGLNSRQLQRN